MTQRGTLLYPIANLSYQLISCGRSRILVDCLDTSYPTETQQNLFSVLIVFPGHTSDRLASFFGNRASYSYLFRITVFCIWFPFTVHIWLCLQWSTSREEMHRCGHTSLGQTSSALDYLAVSFREISWLGVFLHREATSHPYLHRTGHLRSVCGLRRAYFVPRAFRTCSVRWWLDPGGRLFE